MQHLFIYLFIYLYISTDAVHVSRGSSIHHQEHINLHTASGTVNQYCCLLVSRMRWNSFDVYILVCSFCLFGIYKFDIHMPVHLIHDTIKQQYWLTIPEVVCTVMCS